VIKPLGLIFCVALAGCAASGPDTAHAPPAQPTYAQGASNAQPGPEGSNAEQAARAALANAREVDIQTSPQEETVCETRAPTGSRIAVEQCYVRVRSEDGPAEAIARDLNRQEFEEMRQRQLDQEQQRQARERAIRDAMMRRR
jgi:hypothetical protein